VGGYFFINIPNKFVMHIVVLILNQRKIHSNKITIRFANKKQTKQKQNKKIASFLLLSDSLKHQMNYQPNQLEGHQQVCLNLNEAALVVALPVWKLPRKLLLVVEH
jgi:hypothetical protein